MKLRYFENKKARVGIVLMIGVILCLLVFFITVMDAVHKAGVTNVGIAAQPAASKQPTKIPRQSIQKHLSGIHDPPRIEC